MQDYAAFVRDTGHKWNRPTSEFLQPEGKSAKLTVDDVPTFPAFHLSWQDARAFCIWLSKKEGRTYRLPTDHEWSMAVGIGHLEKEDESPAAKNLKVKGGASELVSELETLQTLLDGNHEASNGPMPVGSFAANDLGLYDLRGNVDELCLDLLDPTDPAKGRVLRGGGWLTIRVFDQKFKASGKTLQSEHIGNIVSSSFRRSTNETDLQAGAGFRCVLEESSRANQ